VVYESATPIHVSGHAYQEELKMMINLTRPYYVAPVHGEPRHQFAYNQIAGDMGFPEHRIFTLKDGVPLVLDETKAYLGEKVPCGQVLVDSSGIPGVTDDILRDRFNVANEGIVVITIPLDVTNGALAGDPVIQSRGFFGPEGILELTREHLVDALNDLGREELKDPVRVRHHAMDTARKFIQKRGSLRPLVLATLVEV
jgi:ribonuclease J